MRDSIRGGNAFGTDEQDQGFATGLYTDPSTYTSQTYDKPTQLSTLLNDSDLIRISLAGGLKNFTFTDAAGQQVTGSQLSYGGQPGGYTASPLESVNYCSVHDNQSLFDAVQIKSAAADTITMRARRQVVAMSLITLGEGVPFFFGADDLLRSKDMDNNAYNSGDWFNKIDFSEQGDNWGIGLPLANVNQAQWPIMQPLLANPALKPTPQSIVGTTQAFQEFLRIRYSTRLFRMPTADEVQANLSFLNTGQNQVPGLIAMEMIDLNHTYGPYAHVVTFFNASSTSVTFTAPKLHGLTLQLHPVQKESSDPVVLSSTFDVKSGVAVVPALTTAVFVSRD